MDDLDLLEKRRIIADLTLMNNKFMNKVFDGDIICAQLLLRIILDNDKIIVTNVVIQHKELADKVKLFKEPKRSENTMVDIIDEYAEKKAKQAAYQQKIEFAEGLLADGMSIEFTVRHTKLPIEEVRKLAEKRSA